MTIKRYSHQKHHRRARVRGRLSGSSDRPRLSVFRSNKYIYAQIINHSDGNIIASTSDLKLKKSASKTDSASLVGTAIADLALKNKISNVVFDRGHYHYQGRVKALAEAARKKGLKF